MTNSQLVRDSYPEDSPELEKYSDLQVLKSEAGWYIGTVYTGKEGFVEPGSRDSKYFFFEAEVIEAFDTGNWTRRTNT